MQEFNFERAEVLYALSEMSFRSTKAHLQLSGFQAANVPLKLT